MKAAWIERYGAANELKVAEAGLPPRPGPNELLVRVRAAGLNPADLNVRRGQFANLMSKTFPKILGSDLAGDVVTGAGPFATHDRVFAMLPPFTGGAYAEYAVVPVECAAKLPDSLGYADAAAVPLAALTAWQALVDKAQVRPGQRVLINAAGGGVGSFAVQLARHLGARVTARVSRDKAGWVSELGAQAIWLKDAGEAEGQGSFDVVFDASGSDQPLAAQLSSDGVLVTVRPSLPGFLREALAPVVPFRKRQVLVKPDGQQLAQISQLFADGTLKPVRTRSFRLEEAAEAHAALEDGHVRGKWVLLLDGTLP